MTFLRRKALAISSWVTWLAAPGCKEWAEGLEREVEFIPSDWRALGWALGSTRVLLEPREAPLASLKEVPGIARRYVDSVRSGRNFWFLWFQSPIYLLKYFDDARSGLQHLGCTLVILGALFAAMSVLIERRRLKEPELEDIYDNLSVCVLFYRAELMRQRSRLWTVPLVLPCWTAGIALVEHGDRFFIGLGVFGALIAPVVYLHLRRINRMRIERLDALLAEPQ